MQPEDKNPAYLWDILDAARTIFQFTSGLKIDQYMKDRKLQLAVERLFEIIGEAANRVSKDFQQNHPEIPWRKIKGFALIFYKSWTVPWKSAKCLLRLLPGIGSDR